MPPHPNVRPPSDPDPSPPSPSGTPPRLPRQGDKDEESEDRQMKVGMRMVGSAMVFIGFLQVFLSASTGAEITVFPMILYFTGMALWAYSSIENITIRYTVIILSIICALAFFHFGEVLFWHKYLIYWGTIALVVFFMFKNPIKPPSDR
jgi:hypothetical protein